MQAKDKLESKIQSEILEYLKTISYVSKIIVANKAGTLDIVGCIKGRYYSIEVKKVGETASTLQKVNMLRIREHGGISLTVTSLNEVKKHFEKLLNN